MSRSKIILFSSLALILLLVAWLITPDLPAEKVNKWYANSESKFVELNGMTVHYRDEGSGVPVVLVHGTAASLHTWDGWTDILKQDYRVIRMDIPAFGLTGPHPEADYSIESYVTFLNDFLNVLEVDSFYLTGNSLGGNIAWNYAAEFPEQVKKLILVDAAGMPSDKGIPGIFKLARTPVVNSIIKYLTPRSITEDNLKQVYYDDSKVTEELVDRYYRMVLREGNRQAFIDRAKLDFPDQTQKLENLSMPTLILWGEDDLWIPAEDAYKYQKAIKNAEVVVMKKTGHVPMEERPLESVNIVMRFLTEE